MTRNPQLQSVEWRDLVALTPGEKTWELTLSLPWLLGSLWCYGKGWWWAALACSFYFFLTGLRQSHNAQHYALGLPRPVQDIVLFLLSVLMMASMHAVQTTHLHHHRHCMEEDDGEGATARLSWWRAVLTGPLFYVRLHEAAWRKATQAKRRWIAFELCAVVSVVAAAVFSTEMTPLRWHTGAMLTGECSPPDSFAGLDCASRLPCRRTRPHPTRTLAERSFIFDVSPCGSPSLPHRPHGAPPGTGAPYRCDNA